MASVSELESGVPIGTIDLLHLSCAFSIATMTGSEREFVTRGREFEVYKKEIHDGVGIKITLIA